VTGAALARAGWLLGGRVRHDQRVDGHRSGVEPVLLAASIPARPGQRVLEGGTGAGAALLCLAARVQPLAGVGIERDPAQAAQARANVAANGFAALEILQGDLAALRHHGTLSFVVAAAVLPDCLAAMQAAGCGSTAVLPLWPKPGRAAKLVLLRAVKGGRGPCRLLPGLVLHREAGGYTDAAEAVLRDAAALEL
jgi:tRNA1Val (adenine37-N6)-methyltransferase